MTNNFLIPGITPVSLDVMRSVLVINGPNLNMLGKRRPELYGSTDLSRLEELCRRWGNDMGVSVDTFHSNHEGAIVEALQQCEADGVVLNAGALTHYSIAIRDAIEAIDPPVVEVHISNILEREPFRRLSVIGPVCVYTIYGRGVEGYQHAMRHLIIRDSWPFSTLSYGSDPEQVADLRVPKSERPFPLVMMIHGGHWKHEWSRDTTEPMCLELAHRGIATLNIEYRRVGNGGDIRTMTEDLQAASDLIPSVSPSRWGCLGVSSGGHLALYMAPRFKPSPEFVVSVSGIADLEKAMANPFVAERVSAMAADQNPRDISPITGSIPSMPLFLAHGDSDDAVPLSIAVGYEKRVQEGGGIVELMVAQGEGHEACGDVSSKLWRQVIDRLLVFLG